MPMTATGKPWPDGGGIGRSGRETCPGESAVPRRQLLTRAEGDGLRQIVHVREVVRDRAIELHLMSSLGSTSGEPLLDAATRPMSTIESIPSSSKPLRRRACSRRPRAPWRRWCEPPGERRRNEATRRRPRPPAQPNGCLRPRRGALARCEASAGSPSAATQTSGPSSSGRSNAMQGVETLRGVERVPPRRLRAPRGPVPSPASASIESTGSASDRARAGIARTGRETGSPRRSPAARRQLRRDGGDRRKQHEHAGRHPRQEPVKHPECIHLGLQHLGHRRRRLLEECRRLVTHGARAVVHVGDRPLRGGMLD